MICILSDKKDRVNVSVSECHRAVVRRQLISGRHPTHEMPASDFQELGKGVNQTRHDCSPSCIDTYGCSQAHPCIVPILTAHVTRSEGGVLKTCLFYKEGALSESGRLEAWVAARDNMLTPVVRKESCCPEA